MKEITKTKNKKRKKIDIRDSYKGLFITLDLSLTRERNYLAALDDQRPLPTHVHASCNDPTSVVITYIT